MGSIFGNLQVSSIIESLPVFLHKDTIRDYALNCSAFSVTASAGAGKTSLVPLILSGSFDGKIIVTQPRRLAARACASRLAELIGEKPGENVGLLTRNDNVRGKKIIVMTEGVFVRMIQDDPSLEGVSAVIFDEFHERTINSDLSLAFVYDVFKNLRPDIKIVIMSASLPPEIFSDAIGDIPCVKADGRMFYVDIKYYPPEKNERIEDGVSRLIIEAAAMTKGNGDILVFLPGYREIQKTAEKISTKFPGKVLTLHGSMPPEEQMSVVKRTLMDAQAVILSTNVAETSITINSVRAVVDSGLVRKVRYNSSTGMNYRTTEENSSASALQRCGRAGRVAEGFCLRYWDKNYRKTDFDQPEILTSDLTGFILEAAAFGDAKLKQLRFINNPPESKTGVAMEVLEGLGFIENFKITQSGKKAVSFPFHPRLASMINGSRDDEKATAVFLSLILEEGIFPAGNSCYDISAHAENLIRESARYPRIITDYKRLSGACGVTAGLDSLDFSIFPELLLKAYPDRIAKRVSRGKNCRYILASGRQAVLYSDGPEYLVAPSVEMNAADGKILLYSSLPDERVNAIKLASEVTFRVKWQGMGIKVYRCKMIGMLPIDENPAPVTQISDDIFFVEVKKKIEKEGKVLLESLPKSASLIERCEYLSGLSEKYIRFSEKEIFENYPDWLVPFAVKDGTNVLPDEAVYSALVQRIGFDNVSEIERTAPEFINIKDGRKKKLDYSGGSPTVSMRVQEAFGMRENPRICGKAVIIKLLSPAGRPVQITGDIGGFWITSYPAVRKEMKGRYPKHDWPENPFAK